jgi:hypothetical protein
MIGQVERESLSDAECHPISERTWLHMKRELSSNRVIHNASDQAAHKEAMSRLIIDDTQLNLPEVRWSGTRGFTISETQD